MSDDQAEAVIVDDSNPESVENSSTAGTEEVAQAVDSVEESSETVEDSGEELDNNEDLMDVEIDGEKFKVPSKLHKHYEDGYMRHSDYTRKTQEVADQKRQNAKEKERLAASQNSNDKIDKFRSEILAVDAEIDRYKNVDWDAEFQKDAAATSHHQFYLNKLENAKREKIGELSKAREEALQSQKKYSLEILEQSKKRVASEIKGWDSEMAQTVSKKITELGYSAEFKNALDKGVFPDAVPMIKTIHKAAEYDKMMAKAKKVKSSPSDVVEIRPTKKVQGGSTLRKTIYDKTLTSEQRISLRNKQLKQNN
jgi:hypothetical protein